MQSLENLGVLAKSAATFLATVSSDQKNRLLLTAADSLEENCDYIITENQKDILAGKSANMTDAFLDRLSLNADRIKSMATGLRELAMETDPVGETVSGIKRPNGLDILKVRVPLGVVGIIYEARPNVTADAFGICLKSGNAVILRGGKEAINSNKAIIKVLENAAESCGFPKGTVGLVEDTSRQSATELMGLKYLDLLIPRGGASLIKATVENATVPVIETGVGNCHTYIDASADEEMAVNIVKNAKCSRPSVCNAMETLLVHKDIAERVLPKIAAALKEYDTEIRGCEVTCSIVEDSVLATEKDYETEFLDYILAVKVVDGLESAIEHIRKYSSGHSECIVTSSYENGEKFVNSIDAAAVYINASTRFTDGGQFGMGAEIGISTGKLHTRGPMGVKDLTTVKYIIRGNGQIR